MSRSYKRSPVQTLTGKRRFSFKRMLNRRVRRLWDLPDGNGYRRIPHDGEELHGRREAAWDWDRHVAECWALLGGPFHRNEEEVLWYVRLPIAK